MKVLIRVSTEHYMEFPKVGIPLVCVRRAMIDMEEGNWLGWGILILIMGVLLVAYANNPITVSMAQQVNHKVVPLIHYGVPHTAKPPVIAPLGNHAPDQPFGSPVGDHAVITQGYGMGTHAPANVWGGLDFAIDTNGDGMPEPDSSLGSPLFATLDGVVHVSSTWPCGTGVEITNDTYRVLYCHLEQAHVQDGQSVHQGMQIGTMGQSGDATGPHLHYEIWERGKNINPLVFLDT